MQLHGRTLLAFLYIGGLALADGGSRNYDATYTPSLGGGEWGCPEPGHGFTIANGRFSIPWDINVPTKMGGDESVTIGHIDGTVNADGTGKATATVLSPLPRKVIRVARQQGASLDSLSSARFSLKIDKLDGFAVHLHGELGDGTCEADWEQDPDAAPASAPAATPELDCTRKPYAVAAWSAGHPYGEGAFVQLANTGELPGVYRCAHGCAAGKSPADNDDAWTPVGRCAAAALPAQGAAQWDSTYGKLMSGANGTEWACPTDLPAKLVVSHGTFSIPWSVNSTTPTGMMSTLSVGHLDGVVRADGTTLFRPVVTITELPRELRRMGGDVTIAHLQSIAPTMQFVLETDAKNNPRGTGHRAEFHIGGTNVCEAEFWGADFKRQQFREQDGWHSVCRSDQVWDSKKSYNFGDQATFVTGGVRRAYTCQQSPRCDAGVQPAGSKEWTKLDPCTQ